MPEPELEFRTSLSNDAMPEWHRMESAEVAARLEVDPARGLSNSGDSGTDDGKFMQSLEKQQIMPSPGGVRDKIEGSFFSLRH